MALVYPGADYRQLPNKSTSALDPDVINVHTMVGTLEGTQAWFTSQPYVSHFGVAGDGRVRQWQDLRFRAASDRHGNPFCISIECEDRAPMFGRWTGSDVPDFADPQKVAMIELITWLCDELEIPPVALRTSLPGQRGLSYHRLGIEPWMVNGGVSYSVSYGKVCPGDRRIHSLLNHIFPAVARRLDQEPEDEMNAEQEAKLDELIKDVGTLRRHEAQHYLSLRDRLITVEQKLNIEIAED